MASSKFEMYPVKVGAGLVALAPIPGHSGSYQADFSVLVGWAPSLVLSMTTQNELDRFGAGAFGDDLAAMGIDWRHLPIADFGAPGAEVQATWPEVSRLAHKALAAGGRVLSHCFGGCGRSGTMALRLMVEAGERPADALARLRRTRPCAVEREPQFIWASAGEV